MLGSSPRAVLYLQAQPARRRQAWTLPTSPSGQEETRVAASYKSRTSSLKREGSFSEHTYVVFNREPHPTGNPLSQTTFEFNKHRRSKSTHLQQIDEDFKSHLDTLQKLFKICSSIHPQGSTNTIIITNNIGDLIRGITEIGSTFASVLPPPPLLPNRDWCECAAVGFGLDPQGSDLKVVRLTFDEEGEQCSCAEVYSLKSSRWRVIQVDVEYLSNLMFGDNHTYCNGSYHWEISSGKMLSFDMTREVFELSELSIKDFWICKRFSGCLLAITPKYPSMEVWCMVGSKNWKLVKEFEPYLDEYRFLMPLWRDDDEILFVMEEDEDEEEEDHDYENPGGELYFLNITKQEVRKFPNLGKGRALQLLPYVESLVSIRNWTRSCNYQA